MKCLGLYDRSNFKMAVEHLAEEGNSKVDYVALVDNKPMGLSEVISPSVMTNVCDLLPEHGIELTWVPGQDPVQKILAKVSTLFPLIMALVLRRNV